MKHLLSACLCSVLTTAAYTAGIAGYVHPQGMAWTLQFDHTLQYAEIGPPPVAYTLWGNWTASPTDFADHYNVVYTGPDYQSPDYGDANHDGKTTVIDLIGVLQHYGWMFGGPEWWIPDIAGIRPADCDFNGDGYVDGMDVGTVFWWIETGGKTVIVSRYSAAYLKEPHTGTAQWAFDCTSGCSTGSIMSYGSEPVPLASDTACFGDSHILIAGQMTSASIGAYYGYGAGTLYIVAPGADYQSGSKTSIGFDESGRFRKMMNVQQGIYDIVLKRPGALTKRFPNVEIAGMDLLNLNGQFYFGDIDEDNWVTVFDYVALSDAFDVSSSDPAFYEPMPSTGIKPYQCDLDRDGSVTVFDYEILSGSFDMPGE